MIEYPLRDFSAVKGLNGIPDSLVQSHLKLYEGYVKNINLLRKRLAELKPGVPEFSELQRRVGFEINGTSRTWSPADRRLRARRKRPSRKSGVHSTLGGTSSSGSARCAGSAGRSSTRIR